MSSSEVSIPCCPLPTSQEQQFVVDTYHDIAPYFSITRAYLWECVKNVISTLPPNSVVVEVGCGNGKNLKALATRNDVVSIGCDITPYFVTTSKTTRIDTFQATNMALPMRSGIADLVLSIAVIHHFDTQERRLQALDELLRIVRPGGRILIQVWAKEQQTGSRRTFSQSDNLVGWTNPDKSIFRQRYYHVFHEGELESLLERSIMYRTSFSLVRSWYEKGNWAVFVARTPDTNTSTQY